MESSSYMTCALKVDTQTPGWHKAMIKVLGSIQGVSYNIDGQQGLAYVSGNIDPAILLKMLAKTGKHAELFWVDSRRQHRNNQNPLVQGDVSHYHDYGNRNYARMGYYHGNSYGDHGQHGMLGYDYGNNQLGRLAYYWDDPHRLFPYNEVVQHYPRSEMVSHDSHPTSPHEETIHNYNQTAPAPVPMANKQSEKKLVKCCMM
ncbi:heavy metal-associated isoprenylated plant protein 32-like [Juglans microcarpa x Juglans regia]|uniref:heavy metal-associated isoprenylated plant protein 32-like n=1 Tax=Juglans microcarpa x Juglans regia TaxID=2249226 RepID=UPI001B7F5A6C|nr:heavy metal-associated isoprenylated plant protein 32-like [Juglans microcarpa x Juglans regia]